MNTRNVKRMLIGLLAAMLMLVAALPAAAAAWVRMGIDGSVAADANGLDLVITEYLSDSSSTGVEKIQDKNTAPTTYNAFTYIELYNRGVDTIDLYDYSICRSYIDTTNYDQKDWVDDQSFDLKIKLYPGSIYADYALTDARDTTAPCVNPRNAYLAPGEFAIIWFWNDRTVTVAQRWLADQKEFGEDAAGFRAHYAAVTGKQIPEDTLILCVYAGSVVKDTKQTFDLTTGSNCMFGLVNDPDNDFDPKSSPIYTHNASANTYTFNARVKLLWSWGTGSRAGILAAENKATIFAPANGAPLLYNRDRQRQTEIDTSYQFTPASDYVEIGYVDSYRQAAVLSFAETPTPGAMESYQWALVDPARVPTGAGNADKTGYVADTSGDWKTPVLNAYARNRYPDLVYDPGNEEEKRKPQFVSRDELQGGQNVRPNAAAPDVQYALYVGTRIPVTIALGVCGALLVCVLGVWALGSFARRKSY